MNARNPFLALLCALIFSGCSTRPKTYSAPDATRVNELTAVLDAKVTQARATAAEAKQFTLAAQDSATRLIHLAGTVREKAAQLKELAPVELQWAVIELQTAIEKQAQELAVTQATLKDAVASNARLEQQLKEAETARARLQTDVDDYAGSAAELANDASKENARAVKAEKLVSWYRWHFWGSWIACGTGILACAVFAFLKFTGRIAFTGAQIASKL